MAEEPLLLFRNEARNDSVSLSMDDALFAPQVSFSKDGKYFGVCGSQRLRVWDVDRGTLCLDVRSNWHSPCPPTFASKQPLVFLAERDGQIAVWDLTTATGIRFPSQQKPAINQSFLADFVPATGLFLSICGDDIRGWDSVWSNRRSITFQTTLAWSSCRSVAVSADGEHCAMGLLDRCALLSLPSGKQYRTIPDQNNAWRDCHVAFSPVENLLCIAPEYELHLVRIPEGTELYRCEVKSKPQALAFSPDGRYLFYGGTDACVHVLEIASGKTAMSFPREAATISSLAISPNGRWLASGAAKGRLAIWNLQWATPRKEGSATTPEAFAKLWNDLGSEDAVLAYGAMCRLIQQGDPAVEQLRLQMTPLESTAFSRLLKELDSEDAGVRDSAQSRLKGLGLGVLAQVKAAQSSVPAEVRRRFSELLSSYDAGEELLITRPEALRILRTMTILERIGSDRSDELLREIAKMPIPVRLQRNAAESSARIKRLRSIRTMHEEQRDQVPKK